MVKRKYKYDLYISHNGDNREWVKILAENLKNDNFSVYLEEWQLTTGRPAPADLYEGLNESAAAILVVTPKGVESGWVREEYHRLITRKNNDRDFSILPVMVGKTIPEDAFSDPFFGFEFPTPAEYWGAYQRLRVFLAEKLHVKAAHSTAKSIIPVAETFRLTPLEPDNNTLIREIMELFFQKQAILLLFPAHRHHGALLSGIMEAAEKRHGEENILYISLPFCHPEDHAEYFASLARQCGFNTAVYDVISFLAAFRERLNNGKFLFLVVGGFEHSLEDGRAELAGVLRTLNEEYPDNLKMLVAGGEKLASFFYGGSLSYLNHAELVRCPEFVFKDVASMGPAISLPLTTEIVKRSLELSGGHPVILEHCFKLAKKKWDFTQDEVIALLLEEPALIVQLFKHFCADPEEREKVCRLLEKEVVGPGTMYMYDAFLGRLYWANLLTRSSEKNLLVWRSEALRLAAQKVLGCLEKSEDTADDADLFITNMKIHNVRHLHDIEIPLSPSARTHLILTGKNGSGKTSVLEGLKKQLKEYETPKAKGFGKNALTLAFNTPLTKERHQSGRFLFAYYGAKRGLSLERPAGIKKIDHKDRYGIEEAPGKHFIQHMVNLSAERSFSRDEYDRTNETRIQQWFDDYEEWLREIFEDPTLRLQFDRANYNFKIIQQGREPFDFNTMADGHSAIINIITDLILRMEPHKRKHFDLQGVVLIDELEAHLHIGLQKKVFRFLTRLFPRIQFIITSHSPFILSSIENAVIYDLERQLLIRDLSAYSYDGIVSGYFENDKYSQIIKDKLSYYEQLLARERLTEDEEEAVLDLRKYLSEVPASLAPELKARFNQIELERLGKTHG